MSRREVELGLGRVEREPDLIETTSKPVVDLVDLVCSAVDVDVVCILEHMIGDG